MGVPSFREMLLLLFVVLVLACILGGSAKAAEPFQHKLLVGVDVARSVSILVDDSGGRAGTPGTAVDSVWAFTLKPNLTFGMKIGVHIPDGSSRVGVRFSPGLVFKASERVSLVLPALLYTVTPGYGGKPVGHLYGVATKVVFKVIDGISIGPSVFGGRIHNGPRVVGFKFDVTFWLGKFVLP